LIATAAVMLVMISAGVAYAQTQTGAISGVIRDEQGGSSRRDRHVDGTDRCEDGDRRLDRTV
jgi:hypothetical protein